MNSAGTDRTRIEVSTSTLQIVIWHEEVSRPYIYIVGFVVVRRRIGSETYRHFDKHLTRPSCFSSTHNSFPIHLYEQSTFTIRIDPLDQLKQSDTPARLRLTYGRPERHGLFNSYSSSKYPPVKNYFRSFSIELESKISPICISTAV